MEKKHLNFNDVVSLFIIFLIAVGITCNIVLTQKNLNLVGKQLLMENDTLMVRHYDEHNNLFTLSDNSVVNRKVVKKHLIEND